MLGLIQKRFEWHRDNRRPFFIEIIYWLGIPVFLGITMGWYVVGSIDIETRLGILGFWCVFLNVTWWAQICGTWCAFGILKPWRPAPLVLWMIGPLVFGLVGLPAQNWLLEWGTVNLSEGAVKYRPISVSSLLIGEGWVYYITAAIPGTATFVAVNLIFERIFGVARFRYKIMPTDIRSPQQECSDTEQSQSDPSFMERLPLNVRQGSLVCVSAQEHYISVTTTTGKELVRYSFNDAIRDLQKFDGLRTHRSHWVALEAIKELVRSGSSYQLKLVNGLSIPVSRTYLVNVRQHINN